MVRLLHGLVACLPFVALVLPAVFAGPASFDSGEGNLTSLPPLAKPAVTATWGTIFQWRLQTSWQQQYQVWKQVDRDHLESVQPEFVVCHTIERTLELQIDFGRNVSKFVSDSLMLDMYPGFYIQITSWSDLGGGRYQTRLNLIGDGFFTMTVPLDAAIDEWGRSSEQSVVFFRRDTTRPMSPLLQAYSPYSEMLPQTFEPITFLTKDRSTITYFHFSEPVAFLNFSSATVTPLTPNVSCKVGRLVPAGGWQANNRALQGGSNGQQALVASQMWSVVLFDLEGDGDFTFHLPEAAAKDQSGLPAPASTVRFRRDTGFARPPLLTVLHAAEGRLLLEIDFGERVVNMATAVGPMVVVGTMAQLASAGLPLKDEALLAVQEWRSSEMGNETELFVPTSALTVWLMGGAAVGEDGGVSVPDMSRADEGVFTAELTGMQGFGLLVVAFQPTYFPFSPTLYPYISVVDQAGNLASPTNITAARTFEPLPPTIVSFLGPGHDVYTNLGLFPRFALLVDFGRPLANRFDVQHLQVTLDPSPQQAGGGAGGQLTVGGAEALSSDAGLTLTMQTKGQAGDSSFLVSLSGDYLTSNGDITIRVPETRLALAQDSVLALAPAQQIVLRNDITPPTVNFSYEPLIGTLVIVNVTFTEPIRRAAPASAFSVAFTGTLKGKFSVARVAVGTGGDTGAAATEAEEGANAVDPLLLTGDSFPVDSFRGMTLLEASRHTVDERWQVSVTELGGEGVIIVSFQPSRFLTDLAGNRAEPAAVEITWAQSPEGPTVDVRCKEGKETNQDQLTFLVSLPQTTSTPCALLSQEQLSFEAGGTGAAVQRVEHLANKRQGLWRVIVAGMQAPGLVTLAVREGLCLSLAGTPSAATSTSVRWDASPNPAPRILCVECILLPERDMDVFQTGNHSAHVWVTNRKAVTLLIDFGERLASSSSFLPHFAVFPTSPTGSPRVLGNYTPHPQSRKTAVRLYPTLADSLRWEGSVLGGAAGDPGGLFRVDLLMLEGEGRVEVTVGGSERAAEPIEDVFGNGFPIAGTATLVRSTSPPTAPLIACITCQGLVTSLDEITISIDFQQGAYGIPIPFPSPNSLVDVVPFTEISGVGADEGVYGVVGPLLPVYRLPATQSFPSLPPQSEAFALTAALPQPSLYHVKISQLGGSGNFLVSYNQRQAGAGGAGADSASFVVVDAAGNPFPASYLLLERDLAPPAFPTVSCMHCYGTKQAAFDPALLPLSKPRCHGGREGQGEDGQKGFSWSVSSSCGPVLDGAVIMWTSAEFFVDVRLSFDERIHGLDRCLGCVRVEYMPGPPCTPNASFSTSPSGGLAAEEVEVVATDALETLFRLRLSGLRGEGVFKVTIGGAPDAAAAAGDGEYGEWPTDKAGNAMPPVQLWLVRDRSPPAPPSVTSTGGVITNKRSVTLTLDFCERLVAPPTLELEGMAAGMRAVVGPVVPLADVARDAGGAGAAGAGDNEEGQYSYSQFQVVVSGLEGDGTFLVYVGYYQDLAGNAQFSRGTPRFSFVRDVTPPLPPLLLLLDSELAGDEQALTKAAAAAAAQAAQGAAGPAWLPAKQPRGPLLAQPTPYGLPSLTSQPPSSSPPSLSISSPLAGFLFAPPSTLLLCVFLEHNLAPLSPGSLTVTRTGVAEGGQDGGPKVAWLEPVAVGVGAQFRAFAARLTNLTSSSSSSSSSSPLTPSSAASFRISLRAGATADMAGNPSPASTVTVHAASGCVLGLLPGLPSLPSALFGACTPLPCPSLTRRCGDLYSCGWQPSASIVPPQLPLPAGSTPLTDMGSSRGQGHGVNMTHGTGKQPVCPEDAAALAALAPVVGGGANSSSFPAPSSPVPPRLPLSGQVFGCKHPFYRCPNGQCKAVAANCPKCSPPKPPQAGMAGEAAGAEGHGQVGGETVSYACEDGACRRHCPAPLLLTVVTRALPAPHAVAVARAQKGEKRTPIGLIDSLTRVLVGSVVHAPPATPSPPTPPPLLLSPRNADALRVEAGYGVGAEAGGEGKGAGVRLTVLPVPTSLLPSILAKERGEEQHHQEEEEEVEGEEARMDALLALIRSPVVSVQAALLPSSVPPAEPQAGEAGGGSLSIYAQGDLLARYLESTGFSLGGARGVSDGLSGGPVGAPGGQEEKLALGIASSSPAPAKAARGGSVATLSIVLPIRPDGSAGGAGGPGVNLDLLCLAWATPTEQLRGAWHCVQEADGDKRAQLQWASAPSALLLRGGGLDGQGGGGRSRRLQQMRPNATNRAASNAEEAAEGVLKRVFWVAGRITVPAGGQPVVLALVQTSTQLSPSPPTPPIPLSGGGGGGGGGQPAVAGWEWWEWLLLTMLLATALLVILSSCLRRAGYLPAERKPAGEGGCWRWKLSNPPKPAAAAGDGGLLGVVLGGESEQSNTHLALDGWSEEEGIDGMGTMRDLVCSDDGPLPRAKGRYRDDGRGGGVGKVAAAQMASRRKWGATLRVNAGGGHGGGGGGYSSSYSAEIEMCEGEGSSLNGEARAGHVGMCGNQSTLSSGRPERSSSEGTALLHLQGGNGGNGGVRPGGLLSPRELNGASDGGKGGLRRAGAQPFHDWQVEGERGGAWRAAADQGEEAREEARRGDGLKEVPGAQLRLGPVIGHGSYKTVFAGYFGPVSPKYTPSAPSFPSDATTLGSSRSAGGGDGREGGEGAARGGGASSKSSSGLPLSPLPPTPHLLSPPSPSPGPSPVLSPASSALHWTPQSRFSGGAGERWGRSVMPVAVCAVKFDAQPHDSAAYKQKVVDFQTGEFLREARVYNRLQGLPNIIGFFGVCFDSVESFKPFTASATAVPSVSLGSAQGQEREDAQGVVEVVEQGSAGAGQANRDLARARGSAPSNLTNHPVPRPQFSAYSPLPRPNPAVISKDSPLPSPRPQSAGLLNLSFIMELCSGSLYDIMYVRRLRLSGAQRRRILFGVARGLHYLHAHRMIHRDLKSHNILLDADMEPKLADFGTVKLRKFSVMTSKHKGAGTPNYMPPEQFARQYANPADLLRMPKQHAYRTTHAAPSPLDFKVTEKSDIWAFGCVLVELYMGTPPWSTRVLRDVHVRLAERDWTPPEALSFFKKAKQSTGSRAEAAQLAKACLQIDPDQRPSASQILTELAAWGWQGDDHLDTQAQAGLQPQHSPSFKMAAGNAANSSSLLRLPSPGSALPLAAEHSSGDAPRAGLFRPVPLSPIVPPAASATT